MWLRFVQAPRECGHDRVLWRGAPPSLAAQGFTALLLIWDNASWHRSQAVRHWLRQHNQQVKRGAVGVRLVVCRLPSKVRGLIRSSRNGSMASVPSRKQTGC